MANTKQKTTPILMLHNTRRIKELRDIVEGFIPGLQDVVDSFNALGLGNVTYNQLKQLYNAESFVIERMMDKMPDAPEVAGMKLSKEKVAEMMEKPEGTPLFIQATNAYLKSVKEDLPGQHLSEFWNIKPINYCKLKNNQIEIDEDAMTRADESGKIYASTEMEIEMYNAFQKLCEAMNEANNLMFKVGHSPQFRAEDLMVNKGMKQNMDGGALPYRREWVIVASEIKSLARGHE